MISDEYLGERARARGYEVTYVPDAVKIHHSTETLRFYFHQRRKNIAGRMQLREKGFSIAHPMSFNPGRRSNTWLIGRIPIILLAGAIELLAFLRAAYDGMRGEWPVRWYRDNDLYRISERMS